MLHLGIYKKSANNYFRCSVYPTPHMSINDVEKHYLDYTTLEKVTGEEFDKDRLKKVVVYVTKATEFFNEAL